MVRQGIHWDEEWGRMQSKHHFRSGWNFELSAYSTLAQNDANPLFGGLNALDGAVSPIDFLNQFTNIKGAPSRMTN
jgi:hypothetical protein